MKEKEDKFIIKESTSYREFLNEETGLAAIETDVNIDSWRYGTNKKLNMNVNGTIDIHDCNRSISLDFPAETAEEYHQSRYKLKILLDALRQFDRELTNKHRMGQKILKDFKKEHNETDIQT